MWGILNQYGAPFNHELETGLIFIPIQHTVFRQIESDKFRENKEILTIGIWNINQIIVETSRHIVNQIPDAQIYVYEEVPRILPQDPQMKMKMKALILEASIMATLKAKFQSRKIYSLKYNVVTTKFKLKVGEERVVIGEQIEDICKEKELDISDEMWSNLKCTDSGVEREQMSEALLTSVAFRDSVQELTKIEEEKG